MVTEVCLQVDGIDLTDERTIAVIGERFPDYLWSSADGLVTMTVYVTNGDVAASAHEAAREVEHHISGANVRRVHRDLVTASDIAGRVGLSREAVRKWVQRGGAQPFPTPFDTVGGDGRPSKVWLWSDVIPWLKTTYGMELDEILPDDSTVAHIDACLAKVESYLDRHWQTVTSVSHGSSVLESMFETYLNANFGRPTTQGTVRVSRHRLRLVTGSTEPISA